MPVAVVTRDVQRVVKAARPLILPPDGAVQVGQRAGAADLEDATATLLGGEGDELALAQEEAAQRLARAAQIEVDDPHIAVLLQVTDLGLVGRKHNLTGAGALPLDAEEGIGEQLLVGEPDEP